MSLTLTLTALKQIYDNSSYDSKSLPLGSYVITCGEKGEEVSANNYIIKLPKICLDGMFVKQTFLSSDTISFPKFSRCANTKNNITLSSGSDLLTDKDTYDSTYQKYKISLHYIIEHTEDLPFIKPLTLNDCVATTKDIEIETVNEKNGEDLINDAYKIILQDSSANSWLEIKKTLDTYQIIANPQHGDIGSATIIFTLINQCNNNELIKEVPINVERNVAPKGAAKTLSLKKLVNVEHTMYPSNIAVDPENMPMKLRYLSDQDGCPVKESKSQDYNDYISFMFTNRGNYKCVYEVIDNCQNKVSVNINFEIVQEMGFALNKISSNDKCYISSLKFSWHANLNKETFCKYIKIGKEGTSNINYHLLFQNKEQSLIINYDLLLGKSDNELLISNVDTIQYAEMSASYDSIMFNLANGGKEYDIMIQKEIFNYIFSISSAHSSNKVCEYSVATIEEANDMPCVASVFSLIATSIYFLSITLDI